MSYNVFAGFYDLLTSNVDYRRHAQNIDSLVGRFGGKKGGILLDLACGTGSLSECLDDLGYDVIAVDNSPEMLGVAMDKKFDNGKNIQYLCQDMRELDMFGTIDVTVCFLDSLNHLNSFGDVKRVFEKVSLFCHPGGLFIFDMNTQYKHQKILGENTFVYDTDEVCCIWQNSCQGSRVNIELDFFVPENGLYRRLSESFSENAYPVGDIVKALENTGFELLLCCDGDSGDDLSDTTQRVLFVGKKRSDGKSGG